MGNAATHAHSGQFEIGGTSYRGYLEYAKDGVRLHLFGELVGIHADNQSSITGVLDDLTKVSLHSLVMESSGDVRLSTSDPPSDRYETARLHVNGLLYGDVHLGQADARIVQAQFQVSDGAQLFRDKVNFRFIFDTEKVKKVLEPLTRDGTELGDNPLLTFYTGKHEIIAVDTDIGKVQAVHNPGFTIGGGSSTPGLRNQVWLIIEFAEPLTAESAWRKVHQVRRFLELMAGRKQTVSNLSFVTNHAQGTATRLDVHEVPNKENDTVGNISSLVDAVGDRPKYEEILKSYIGTDSDRSDSRWQFTMSYTRGNNYDIPRLLSAAIAFDILPNHCVPTLREYSTEMTTAKGKMLDVAKKLNNEAERHRATSMVGRLDSPSLASKVKARTTLLPGEVQAKLPDLGKVIEQAVKCRNYFVHGGKSTFEYERHFGAVAFFIDTLNFVYGVSELCEAGGNGTRWSRGHPFSDYLGFYHQRLYALGQVCRL